MFLKILHIIAQEPGYTGSGTYLNALIRHFHNLGHTQGLLAGLNQGLEHHISCKEDLLFFPVYFNTPKIPFPLFGMSDTMPYASSQYSDWEGKGEIWEKAFEEVLNKTKREYESSVVLVHHLWILCGKTLEVYENTPVYAFCHGTDLRQLEKLPQWLQFLKKRLQRLSGIFVPTENLKREVELTFSYPKDKIFVISGGYEKELFYYKKEERDSKTLVYAGKWSYSKGFPYVVESFKRLFQRDKSYRLMLYGSGTFQDLSCYFTEKEQKNIQNFGQVPQNVLAEGFRKGNIFLMPSLYEAQGLVVLEALACGMLVVCSDIQNIKEALSPLEDSPVICWLKHPKHFQENVYQIDEKFVEKIVESCIYFEKQRREEHFSYFEKIPQFAWENIILRIQEVIEQDK